MGHNSIIAKMNKLIHEHIILAVWEWIQVEEEKTKIKKNKKNHLLSSYYVLPNLRGL